MECFEQKKIPIIRIPSEKYGDKYYSYEKAYGIQETENPFYSKVGTYRITNSIKDLIK